MELSIDRQVHIDRSMLGSSRINATVAKEGQSTRFTLLHTLATVVLYD